MIPIAYERRRGVRCMVWHVDGAWRPVADLARHYRVPHKTVRTRFESLRRRKLDADITSADLLACLKRQRRRPGPPQGKGRNAQQRPPRRIELDLLHLLALGAPVAIRAEYARRMASR